MAKYSPVTRRMRVQFSLGTPIGKVAELGLLRFPAKEVDCKTVPWVQIPPLPPIMAHTRKDTLTRTVQWWKHLRKFNKHVQSKKERKAAEKEVKKHIE